MNIKPRIMNELFDGNIRIENLFHMELVTACDSMPESFWEVFNDDHEEVLKAIGLRNKDISGYADLESKSELMDFLLDNKVTGFLIHFSTPVPRDFEFRDDGEFVCCSSGWGISTWSFAFGSTLEDALEQAIKVQQEYFDACVVKAREDRGLNYDI